MEELPNLSFKMLYFQKTIFLVESDIKHDFSLYEIEYPDDSISSNQLLHFSQKCNVVASFE